MEPIGFLFIYFGASLVFGGFFFSSKHDSAKTFKSRQRPSFKSSSPTRRSSNETLETQNDFFKLEFISFCWQFAASRRTRPTSRRRRGPCASERRSCTSGRCFPSRPCHRSGATLPRCEAPRTGPFEWPPSGWTPAEAWPNRKSVSCRKKQSNNYQSNEYLSLNMEAKCSKPKNFSSSAIKTTLTQLTFTGRHHFNRQKLVATDLTVLQYVRLSDRRWVL